MKKLFSICAALLVAAWMFLPQQVVAQAPKRFSYQAVVRDAGGQILKNTKIGIKVSIENLIYIPSITYITQYVETHTPTTNENGLVSLEIGSGNVEQGVFANIDWSLSAGGFYIKTEIDPNGKGNYTISERTKLLSVPYALHANNVKTYKVGDFAHGGIVFWVDETAQHGLVCAKYDQSYSIRWMGSKAFAETAARGDGPKAGFMNTVLIIATHGYIKDQDQKPYAALTCSMLQITEGGKSYGDWYLPSFAELKLMYENKAVIEATAVANGGTRFSGKRDNNETNDYDYFYWSSTVDENGYAWSIFFDSTKGSPWYPSAVDAYQYLRCVRAF
mgnify:CR=1|jgi:hypothetical protein